MLTEKLEDLKVKREGRAINISKGASKQKPDTNQTYLNRKDHTSCGPTGGNQTTTRTLGREEGHPQPGPGQGVALYPFFKGA